MSTMSEKSEFSLLGLFHKLCLSAEKVGWTKAHFNLLAESAETLKLFLLVLNGRAKVVVNPILELVRTVIIPAQPVMTTSRKYFEDAGVVSMCELTEAILLDRKVDACAETELRVSKLLEDTRDGPILNELGDKVEISPTQLTSFLNQNREGSVRFIFYVRDAEGNLRAVRAIWYAEFDGWFLRASSVARSRLRDDELWVVSHN